MTQPNIIDYKNKELIKDIWSYIKPYKFKFWLGTVIRITSDLVWLFPVWAISEIITFVSNYQSGESVEYIWTLIFFMALAALYHFIAHDLCKYFVYQVAEQSNLDAQTKGTKYMYDLDMSWHEKENTGNKMQKILKGGESLNQIIRIYVDMVIESTINLIAILIILTTLNFYFALILSFFFITYYILSYQLLKKAKTQVHLANLEWENFNGTAFESINNIAVIKALALGKSVILYLNKTSEKLVKVIKKRIYYYRIRESVLNLYQEIFRVILMVFTLVNIFNGQLEVGVLAMVLLYFGKIEESAYEFSKTYNSFIVAKISMFRMKEVMQTKPRIEISGDKLFNPDWKNLNIKNLTFKYHGKNVLDNFSLEIKKGEKVGIVGISGTGKSTLFKLLLKLYDNYSGCINFDNTELKDIKRSTFLDHMVVVPQETELFNLSLRENITIANQKNKSDKKLQEALHVSHVEEFLHKLPNGLDSLVGEKGIKLSGGEKQRVGIARAVYKNPDILLLDEATSHLDIDSEKKIQDALKVFLKDITAIVIAHRLTTIKEMDKIIVMDKGKVLEAGSFEELIKLRGKFFELWEKQKF